MHTLQFNEIKLYISDFANIDGIIAFDTKFESKDAFENFLNFSKKYTSDDASIDYNVDKETYHGHFGLIVYDINYNVRFYMTTNRDCYSTGTRQNIWKENVNRILNNQRVAIEKIAQILSDNNLASSDDVNDILKMIPAEEYGFAIGHLVTDLNKYLSDGKETIVDLRKNNK